MKLWFVVSKGMLPVRYICTNKAFSVSFEFHGDHGHKDEVNLVSLSILDIAGFKTVVSVCLFVCRNNNYLHVFVMFIDILCISYYIFNYAFQSDA